MTLEIQVKIVEIIYQNSDNGYTVAVGENESDGGELQCTVVGTLPMIAKGRSFILRGKWKNHLSYGEQFAFSEYEEIMPGTSEGIFDFLSSGILKGIGPKIAAALVNHFGEETLRIIEEEPHRLVEVDGIGTKKAASISESFGMQRELAEVTLFFQQFGIDAKYAMKLYKQYGAETVELVKENPYRIIGDFQGIGFRKADNIARKMGTELDDIYRLTSGIKYTLSRFIGEGHTFAYRGELLEEAANLLEVSIEKVEEALVSMVFEGDVHIDNLYGSDCVYPYVYFAAEQNVCRRLAMLSETTPKFVTADTQQMISAVEAQKGITLSRNQRYAVTAAVANSVCIITGGPGTGKTTIINAMIQTMTNSGLLVAIAAPTGRAAKRITETSGFPASTVHRLLEYSFSEDEEILRFGRNAENPLEYDAIIVDEASMLDLLLMNGLVNAIKPGTRLILVGDADQLPSVGAGNILRDIIDSEYLYCVKLDEIFRQASESLIVVNAHRINKGEYPDYNETDKDFFLVRRDSEKQMLETIKDLCIRRLPEYYKNYIEGFVPERDIQVLTPVRKNTLGTINLNRELQKVINPPREDLSEKKIGDRIFRENDKVMQIKNNYNMKWRRMSDFSEGEGVFNGDMGIIENVDTEFNQITVVFDEDKYVTYDYTNFDELELAYAVTVHKSQGSEFQIIVMPVSWFPPMLATRNLLYTAVTRGKSVVVLVGSENKLKAMVDNNSIKQRNSGLAERLRRHRDFVN